MVTCDAAVDGLDDDDDDGDGGDDDDGDDDDDDGGDDDGGGVMRSAKNFMSASRSVISLMVPGTSLVPLLLLRLRNNTGTEEDRSMCDFSYSLLFMVVTN